MPRDDTPDATTLSDAACLVLLRHVPAYAQRILAVGTACEVFLSCLQRPGVQVRSIAPGAFAQGGEASGLPPGHFDLALLLAPHQYAAELGQVLDGLAPCLNDTGHVMVLLPNGQFWRAALEGPPQQPLTFEETLQIASARDFHLYSLWDQKDQAFEEAEPDDHGALHLDGHRVPAGDAAQRARQGCIAWLLMLIRPNYNPMEHARACAASGHPNWTYEILTRIPDAYQDSPDARAGISAEALLALLEWAKQSTIPEHRHGCFVKAQQAFFDVVANAPDFVPAYQCQAEFWRLMGDPDMGTRLLRSAQHAVPNDSVAGQIAAMAATPTSPPEAIPVAPWTPPETLPRILYVLHPRPHYGLDVLYDGLCLCLGDENVVDFPFKPYLHGEIPERLANYPCNCNHAGRAYDLDEIVEELRAGRFDLILYGDCEEALDRAAARRIAEAGKDVPLFVIDELDEFVPTWEWVRDYLGLPSVAGYFKREMLACVDYGSNAFPMPFAYPDGRIAVDTAAPRTQDFFWAGHRRFGVRRLYLEHIERILGRTFNQSYSPEEYAAALRDTRIGINLHGAGFDTVRYWELPAHGCMLLSERLPIRIPEDFEDGQHAVFFDDLRDLEDKLGYYFARPEEAQTIARAGYEHLKKYHTGSARARQLLGWIGQVLGRSS